MGRIGAVANHGWHLGGVTLPVAGLPPDLIHHLVQVGGGGVSLIVGAGTSIEAPTNLKSSAVYAAAAHAELVREDVIGAEDCLRPDDLSQVADAVFAATGSQLGLVVRLPVNQFRAARANRGHLAAVACLLEGAVRVVITLNYDLALTNAIAELGAGQQIGIVESPADAPQMRMTNLFFLHRSAHQQAEDWVIRSIALNEGWQNGWEALVAAQAGASPVVVFAGLGTPVPVLVATVERLRTVCPKDRERVFLAGPGAADDSAFAVALGLAEANYIQRTWCSLMDELGRNLAGRMCDRLLEACRLIETQRGYAASGTLADTCVRLEKLDLVDLGRLRAAWLLTPEPYQPETVNQRPLIAELLLGIALIQAVAKAQPVFSPIGLVTLTGDERRSAVVAFASGSGHLNWLTVESMLKSRLGQLMAGTPRPGHALLAAIQGGRVAAAGPEDIVGDVEPDSILFDHPVTLIDIEEVRANPALSEHLLA